MKILQAHADKDQFEINNQLVMRARSAFYVSELCYRLNTSYSMLPNVLAEKSPRYAKKIKTTRSKIYRCASEEYDLRDNDLITAFDDALPGSARIAGHPLWALLTDDNITQYALATAAQQLRPSIYLNLLTFNVDTDFFELKNQVTQHRNKMFYQALTEPPYDETPSLDCLVGLIIYAKICTQSTDYNLDIILAARLNIQNMLLNLARQKRFNALSRQLYRLVNEKFVESLELDMSERFEFEITVGKNVFCTPQRLEQAFDDLRDSTPPLPIHAKTHRKKFDPLFS